MKSNKLLISVIVPVYNAEKYIDKCIQSIISQTYKNLEIIIIDDGSNDLSGKIIDCYAENDNRIKAIHQDNHGESNARNTGLRIAQGDYITFVDNDDWIDENMYESLTNKAYSTHADIVACSWYKEYPGKTYAIKNESEVSKDVFDRRELLHYVYKRDEYRGFAYMWNKIYRRELLYRNKHCISFNEKLKLGGDVLFLGEMVLNANSAAFIDQSYYHYRQRDDSGCHAPDLIGRLDWLKAYEILIEEFSKEEVDGETLLFIKRFLAYHAAKTTELAIEQKNGSVFKVSNNLMKQYENEYRVTNLQYEDRILWYDRLLNYDKI